METLTTCRHGHTLTEDNVYVRNGRTWCRACRSESDRRYRERQRAMSSSQPWENQELRASVLAQIDSGRNWLYVMCQDLPRSVSTIRAVLVRLERAGVLVSEIEKAPIGEPYHSRKRYYRR